MCLWETLVIPAFIEAKLVLPLGREVERQTIASPDKLEIGSTLLWCELSEDTPEASYYIVTFSTVRVCGMPTQTFHINSLLTTGSYFHSSRSQVAEHIKISFKDSVDSILKSTILLKSLHRSGLNHKRDELLHVGL